MQGRRLAQRPFVGIQPTRVQAAVVQPSGQAIRRDRGDRQRLSLLLEDDELDEDGGQREAFLDGSYYFGSVDLAVLWLC